MKSAKADFIERPFGAAMPQSSVILALKDSLAGDQGLAFIQIL